MKLSQTNKDIITVIILILLALFMDNIINF
jgi:hypothetical protein